MSQYNDTGCLTDTTAEDIAQHRNVRFDGSGNLVYCDAGEMPLGPAYAFTASGKPCAYTLLRGKTGTIKQVAAGAIDARARVYTAADGKISATNTGVLVGIAREAASGDGSVIEVLPDLRYVAYVNTAASSVAGASSTAENTFDVSHSIPASEIVAGSVFRVKASGIVVDQDSNPQCDIRLKVGTETVATATVAAAADNDEFNVEAEVVIRTIGASGTLIAQTKDAHDAAGTGPLYVNKASASEDTTGGLAVTLTAQFDGSHADNKARLDLLMVEHLR